MHPRSDGVFMMICKYLGWHVREGAGILFQQPHQCPWAGCIYCSLTVSEVHCLASICTICMHSADASQPTGVTLNNPLGHFILVATVVIRSLKNGIPNLFHVQSKRKLMEYYYSRCTCWNMALLSHFSSWIGGDFNAQGQGAIVRYYIKKLWRM